MVPNIPYSQHKHRRWELLQHMENYIQQEPADPNHLIVTAMVDPYTNRGHVLAMSDTSYSRKRQFTPRVNMRSAIRQQQLSLANRFDSTVLGPGSTNSNDATVPIPVTKKTRVKRGQHRNHHKPNERPLKLDFAADEPLVSVPQSPNEKAQNSITPEVSALILEPRPMVKKSHYHYYEKRWSYPEKIRHKRDALQSYMREVNKKSDPNELLQEMYLSLSEESDEEPVIIDDTYSVPFPREMQTTKPPEGNLFCDPQGKLFTGKVTVQMEPIDSQTSAETAGECSSRAVSDHVLRINKPTVLTVDLSALTSAALHSESDRVDSDNLNSYKNVAYLIIRESATQPQSTTPSNLRAYSVQLRVALTREGRRLTRNKSRDPIRQPDEQTLTVDALIQQAVQALKVIPAAAYDWESCQPYELYEIKDPQTGLVAPPTVDEEDSLSSVISVPTEDEDELESSFVIIDPASLEESTKCVLCENPLAEDPIELCVNQHLACYNSPVWKCADFLRLYAIGSNYPAFYANTRYCPDVVVAVTRSTDKRPLPISVRPMEVLFDESSQRRATVIPKIYFKSDLKDQIHSPASCEIVRKYRILQHSLGDSLSTSASAKPASEGINPVNLPKPDDVRSDAYCNALSAAWRRNCTRKLFRSRRSNSSAVVWKDELHGTIIPPEKAERWMRTLNEIQSTVEYSFVMAHFEPEQPAYLDMASELMQKELYLGEALKIYPISDNRTGEKCISTPLVEQMVTKAQHLDSRFFREQK
ncbi:unnamed protein product [Echinostoma caproni]|uniref:NARG2_C domain-containing protein n=1 Tax=Echinostoma caproni TaxID=27848 RepID=A0A183AIT4_9TREM|nr:unnamed protein product [Echinostoma caproni]